MSRTCIDMYSLNCESKEEEFVHFHYAVTLPVSQFDPVNPDLQMHRYELIWSKHVPCRQGELRHSSISNRKIKMLKYR